MRGARIGLYLAVAAIAFAQIYIETDKAEHRRIEGGTDTFTLDLKSGDYIEILAEQTSVDIALRLTGPDGKQIQEVDHLRIGGTEQLIYLADRDGAYTLTVRPVREGSSGDYTVTLTVRRPAEAKDREVAEADARFRDLLTTNSPDSAQAMEELAGEFGSASEARREAQAFASAGAMRARNYLWDRAMDDYHKALTQWRAIKDLAGEGGTFFDLGVAYVYTSRNEKAIAYCEQAAAVARETRDRTLEGGALNGIGNAYYAMSQYDKAIVYYEQALSIRRELKDRVGEGGTLNNLGNAHFRMSQYGKSIGFYEQALSIRRELKDRVGEGGTLNDLGNAYGWMSQYEKSIGYYEQALSIRRELKDRAGEGDTLGSLANTYLRMSQYEKAIGQYSQALVIEREVKDRANEAGTLTNLGMAYSDVSQYQKAIGYYEQALVIFREIKERDGEGMTLSALGDAYGSMSQYEKAIGFYVQALAISREVKDREGEGRALNNLANVYQYMSQYEKAIGYYEQALVIFREVNERDGEGDALHGLGDAYGLRSEHEKAIGYYEQALVIFREVKDRAGEGDALNGLGDSYDHVGRRAKAIGYHEEALAIAREIKSRASEFKALDSLMQTYQALQQPRLAVFYGKQAVNVIQSIRTDIRGLSEESSKSFLESKKDSYRRLTDILVSQGRLIEAQEALNLLKEQEFFDYVTAVDSRPVLRGADLTTEESDWANRYGSASDTLAAKGVEMEELREQLKRQPSLADSPDTKRELAELQKDVEAGNRVFQQFLGELKQHFAAKVEFGATTIAVKEVESMKADLNELKHGAVAIYTLVTPERYVAILVTPTEQRAYETKIKAAELNQKILAFREAIGDPGSDPLPMAQELFRILIPSALAVDLRQAQAETLMWSLDGPLRYVPVTALHDGKQYLIEKYRTAVFTPASNARLKEPPQTTWRGVAFGVTEARQGFEALPAVAGELRSIIREKPSEPGVLDGRRLIDAQFTRAALDRYLALSYPVVHVASHFQFRPGDETRSFLLLGDGGALTLADLKAVDTIFAGVDLLTLSACSTGLGDVKSSDGSEVEGFGVLAQRKGAKAVIASLWPVADQSTGLLMREFYRARQSNTSITKIEALRGAQLRLLRGDVKPADRAVARGVRLLGETPKAGDYRHPFYWAPFFLMGNWL